MKTIITFADWGQDFLTWTCDTDGTILKSGPYQAWLWVGAKVITRPELGKLVQIHRQGFVTTPLTIKYPVMQIETVADEVAA